MAGLVARLLALRAVRQSERPGLAGDPYGNRRRGGRESTILLRPKIGVEHPASDGLRAAHVRGASPLDRLGAGGRRARPVQQAARPYARLPALGACLDEVLDDWSGLRGSTRSRRSPIEHPTW